MADSNLLALTIGAGSGVALWYLFEGIRKEPAIVAARTDAISTTPLKEDAPPVAPCQLRLTSSGLSVDGRAADIPSAVAQCKLVGRADVHVTVDAPAAVVAELNTALIAARVGITSRRNGRASPSRTRARRQLTHDLDLADFAATVSAIAEQVDPDPTPEGLARGRFAVRKVFIAAIRRGLRDTEYAWLSRTTIDALLVEAMRDNMLRLARVDLPAAMDPTEIRDSEIKIVNGTYHFVISEPPEGVDVRTKSDTPRKR